MESGVAKLSLLAQYNDICRYTSVLTEGFELDFIKLLKKCEIYENNKKKAEKETLELQKQLSKSKAKISDLEITLKDISHCLEVEIKKRKKAENDRNVLKTQISLIRKIILVDQNTLNDQTKQVIEVLDNNYCSNKTEDVLERLQTVDKSSSLISLLSDVSFDKIDDTLNSGNANQLKGRRSRRKKNNCLTNDKISIKRRKSQKIDNIVSRETSVITAITDLNSRDFNCKIETVSSGRVTTTKYFNNEFVLLSENHTSKSSPKSENNKEQDLVDILDLQKLSTPFQVESDELKIPVGNSAEKLIGKDHVFCLKLVIYPETCSPCSCHIKYYKQALKCQDCGIACHPECIDKVPLCDSFSHTPSNKETMGMITDYTPLVPPMIPTLIIHCIREIELRGLNEIGLYRVSGNEEDIIELKEKFLREQAVPDLSKINIHVICSTVKEFLTLQEPLISSAWSNFVNASEMKDNEDSQNNIHQAVSQLPRPNRDTLSYIILHLQKVAKNPKCKMPISKLAKIFGPIIIGFSTPDLSIMDMVTETEKQHMVMEKLLTISSDYWNSFVDYSDENIFTTVLENPEYRLVRAGSVLGPLPECNQDSLSKKSQEVLGKPPLGIRNNNSAKHTARRHRFFTSPKIK
ncbi:rac GTPase-activating protein 1-like isoform X1 [Centruroides vittatus]|uniref:rac GTPase-activating protein 1-like isoform X1 n=1 Tax=Centruroides vittatus TaxID=120091 RepID=UPI00350F8E49